MIDISTLGCRIESPSAPSAGTWVWLSIAGLDSQYCRVVWQCQEFAGLEFATPLADAVLERLLGDQQDLSETAVAELREIAVRTRRLAEKQKEADTQILVELSRTCALEAVIGGLQLGEAAGERNAEAQKPLSR